MNIFMTIDPAVAEAPDPKASAARTSSPELGGAFDILLAQLMQAILTLPVQAELAVTDQTMQAKENLATALPAAGAAQGEASMSLLTALQTVQSASAKAIMGLPDGAEAPADAIPFAGQAVQAEANTAAALFADDAAREMAPLLSLTALQTVQSAFAAMIEDALVSSAPKEGALPEGSARQVQTALPEALSASADAAEEGINLTSAARPDSKEGAQIVQPPADAVKKAPAIEAQQPQVMREIILAEGSSNNVTDDLPLADRNAEINILPETLQVNSAGPEGMIRFHAEAAGSPAAVANVRHLSEGMHIEGNRLVITRLDGTSLQISLQPEGLGKLDIGLLLDKGVVNAQIQASSVAGKELIEKHMADIVNALAQEGIAIGGFSVSLKDDRNNFSWSQRQSQGHEIQGEPAMNHEYISIPRQVIDRGVVSIFV
ncbi:MAG: flagellar hook-length control protein FliK [Nitrospirae bacterium]|nr:flagellar hook-length control protein FliK [Nitrospirota bacterium]